jgi:hypothetical protein
MIDGATQEVLDEKYNVVCVGGITCLNEYVETITFVMHTINNVNYRIYPNGTVFTEDGVTVVCKTGGEGCLLRTLES